MAAGTGTAGDILAILRDGTPRTKTELADLTGQARSTIKIRLDELLAKRLIGEAPDPRSTGGRPSTAYVFLGDSQYVLAADLAAHAAVLAVTNLRAEVVAHWTGPLAFESGPAVVVPQLVERLRTLLQDAGIAASDVIGVGVGIAAAVEYATGRVNSPVVTPEWDGFDLSAALAQAFSCPAFVDNDANVLAIGEQRTHFPNVREFLYVQLGSGIGAGIITNGRISRGGDGFAGDLSHIYSPDAADILCRCGNRGCVVTVAGGYAIAEKLSAIGHPSVTPHDVVEAARSGNPEIALLIRSAARALGGTLATAVSFMNPEVIVIGGDLSELGEPLLAGVREAVYGRALPYATRHLQVMQAQDATFTGVIGAAHLALESVLHPRRFDETFPSFRA